MYRTAFLFIGALSLAASSCLAQEQPTQEVKAELLEAPNRLVNVKEFGAKGDGRADDTAAIQRAIDTIGETGGVVYVPEGDYRITKSLIVGGQPVQGDGAMIYTEIRGAGKYASRLLGDGPEYIIRSKEVFNEKKERDIVFGMHLRDLTFASYAPTKYESNSGGIDTTYMIKWSVRHCVFMGLKTGIYSAEKSKMTDEASTAVYIIRIHDNIFQGCQDYAIKLGHIFDLSIQNNEIEHGTGGIAVGAPGDGFDAAANTVRITNNLIEGLKRRSTGDPRVMLGWGIDFRELF